VSQLLNHNFNSSIEQSSTFRELKAAEFVLLALHSHLSGRFVKLYSDNQNVVRIVNVGSMKCSLTNHSNSPLFFTMHGQNKADFHIGTTMVP
jgi:hypothetical protein